MFIIQYIYRSDKLTKTKYMRTITRREIIVIILAAITLALVISQYSFYDVKKTDSWLNNVNYDGSIDSTPQAEYLSDVSSLEKT